MGRGKYRGEIYLEFAPDSLEILRDFESETGIKLVVPKLLAETQSLEVDVTSSLFREWPFIEEAMSNEVLDALHKTQDLTMMKMMILDIKRCDEYTVHSLSSEEFTLSLVTNQPNIDLVIRVGLKPLDQKSWLAKVRTPQDLLSKIFQKHLAENGGFAGQPGLMKKFVDSVAHLEVKSQVYHVLVQELEALGIEFTLKKDHMSPVSLRFSVYAKQKLIDVEVDNTSVRCCAYCSPFLSMTYADRTFYALRPMTAVHIRDLPEFLRSAVRAQR